jgi:hypothetical protein
MFGFPLPAALADILEDVSLACDIDPALLEKIDKMCQRVIARRADLVERAELLDQLKEIDRALRPVGRRRQASR